MKACIDIVTNNSNTRKKMFTYDRLSSSQYLRGSCSVRKLKLQKPKLKKVDGQSVKIKQKKGERTLGLKCKIKKNELQEKQQIKKIFYHLYPDLSI